MSINDYIKKIDSYDDETLKSISTRSPIAFRSYFKLLSVSINKPLLTTEELERLRDYIGEKLNPSEKVQLSDSPFEGDTTDESSVESDYNHLTHEIERLSVEAYKLLKTLQSDCKRLQTHSSQERELVAEFKDFIVYAEQVIDEATSEPELTYTSQNQERYDSLTRIIDQIQSNKALMMPILKSQPTLPTTQKKPATNKQSSVNNNDEPEKPSQRFTKH